MFTKTLRLALLCLLLGSLALSARGRQEGTTNSREVIVTIKHCDT